MTGAQRNSDLQLGRNKASIIKNDIGPVAVAKLLSHSKIWLYSQISLHMYSYLEAK